eukprot:GFUD01137989.1.p1 GENE.GFUD01137989.1~~GFUD01137989.1.p1  ORF type:complete len:171 (-),score=61.61 GFUD01137989.1:208-720(-)
MAGDTLDLMRLKNCVESWREVVLIMDSVLAWEKDWYPAVTAGSLTMFYMFLYWLSPSMLTLLSTLGLFFTLLDYLGPKLMDKIFSPNLWSGEKEKKLENVCKSLVSLSLLMSSCYISFTAMKTTSPLTHFSVTTISLLLLAYLGSLVSGQFLSYIILLVVLMLPGLYRYV